MSDSSHSRPLKNGATALWGWVSTSFVLITAHAPAALVPARRGAILAPPAAKSTMPSFNADRHCIYGSILL